IVQIDETMLNYNCKGHRADLQVITQILCAYLNLGMK
ncbi:hypothetical protein H311_05042, partial [Anncaliia algerae PRA109]